MEYLKFWDVAPIVYLVGYLLAFIAIHERLARSERYRIPTALFIAIFWPLIIVMLVILWIEDIIYKVADWITKKM